MYPSGLVPAEPPLELRDAPVLQLRGAPQVGLALGALELRARLDDLALDVGDGAHGLLLALPLDEHRVELLAALGQVGLDRRQALLGGLVGLVAQRLLL